MKKIILGVFTVFVVILLTGCESDNPEVALCKKITPQIEKYEKSSITYKEFLSAIKSDYNKYCSKDPETICTFISNMYMNEQVDLELEDCTKYNEQTGKTFKDLCEATNETKKALAKDKEKTEKSSLSLLKKDCSMVK